MLGLGMDLGSWEWVSRKIYNIPIWCAIYFILVYAMFELICKANHAHY
jgi:hypothetical protein